MRPSAYHAKLSKDQTVESRDGVKVTFAGGSVFHLLVDGAEKPISARGVKAAWERAEAERKKLDPAYKPIPYVKPLQEAPPAPAETDGVPAGENPVAPADNAGGSEPKPDETPKADDPPAKGKKSGKKAASEGAGATQDDPLNTVSFEGGEFPINLVAVEDVVAALGEIQGRLPGFIGDPKLARLQERVRATDGRCAPVFFTGDPEGEEIMFFAGLETLGAAKQLGMKRIAVVILPPETARESQGPISAIFTAANAQVGMQDDDMVYRAYQ